MAVNGTDGSPISLVAVAWIGSMGWVCQIFRFRICPAGFDGCHEDRKRDGRCLGLGSARDRNLLFTAAAGHDSSLGRKKLILHGGSLGKMEYHNMVLRRCTVIDTHAVYV
ncbi:hypothetical protein ACLOJK_034295 [Asimina triloba]